MKIKTRCWRNDIFIAKKQQKTISNFPLDSLNVTE